MAIFSVEIPDVNVLSFAEQHRYEKQVIDPASGEVVDNPESPESFTKRVLISFVFESIKSKEVVKAGDLARQSKSIEIDSTVIIKEPLK